MRLLQLQRASNFSLVEFLGNNIPPYGILSHTWGPSNEEVTYQDLLYGTGEGKSGYRKLTFCKEQAAKDGLYYFWIDTCCINKDSSAELSEAINSMFRWYHEAVKCYVFLSDVSTASSAGSSVPFPQSRVTFAESRWFTRGWTLQELLAPACVEFFSLEGDLLANKHSRVQYISEITNIATEALIGKSMSHFSIEERMAWASRRETTREEDMVYSLFGVFDVHMPLIYGEGREKALKRLHKEIGESSGDAAAVMPQDAKTNSPTRDARLSKIHNWLAAPDPSINYQKALKLRQHDTGLWFLDSERYAKWKTDAASSLWLHGIPGCGKTILSSTILQNLLQHHNNNPGYAVVYFYFDFNDVQKQDAELMLRSLVVQLSQQAVDVPASLDALLSSCEDGRQQPSIDALLQVACQTMQQLPQVYVMLDALDECAQRAKLMRMLETIAGLQLPNVHLIVTSRRERDIESSLEDFVDPQNIICLQSEVVDKDIQQYVRRRLSDDKGLRKWGKDVALRQDIESALMEGSRGM
jgi:hypothetical protein